MSAADDALQGEQAAEEARLRYLAKRGQAPTGVSQGGAAIGATSPAMRRLDAAMHQLGAKSKPEMAEMDAMLDRMLDERASGPHDAATREREV
ncbi:MAG: hypothetical protein ACYDGR_11240 [Candidatus Dormibacteria bacterium]